eukprot:762914-Hanusia_phi.AAC.10
MSTGPRAHHGIEAAARPRLGPGTRRTAPAGRPRATGSWHLVRPDTAAGRRRYTGPVRRAVKPSLRGSESWLTVSESHCPARVPGRTVRETPRLGGPSDSEARPGRADSDRPGTPADPGEA